MANEREKERRNRIIMSKKRKLKLSELYNFLPKI